MLSAYSENCTPKSIYFHPGRAIAGPVKLVMAYMLTICSPVGLVTRMAIGTLNGPVSEGIVQAA
jgi:hypothetical protein